jgi:hypothetical protein
LAGPHEEAEYVNDELFVALSREAVIPLAVALPVFDCVDLVDEIIDVGCGLLYFSQALFEDFIEFDAVEFELFGGPVVVDDEFLYFFQILLHISNEYLQIFYT